VLVHRSSIRILTVVASLVVLSAACGTADPQVAAPDDEPDAVEASPDPAEPEPQEAPGSEPPAPDVDPAEVGADELGLVPVLMYHRLREEGTEYDLTPEQFRGELVWLFDNGYRPVRTIDLVRGRIDIPAGTSPVVLTFDDSTREQAGLTPDGQLDPETSMAILIEVASAYDDVEPVASLYVITSSLFGGTAAGGDTLVRLHELGMEIGNHTHTHPSLASLDAAGVQDELATNVAEVRALVPDAEVATLSLPLGVFPEDRSLVARGSSAAGSYENEGVLLVGSNPAPSPFSVEFDPLAIPRIRSSPSWDGGEPDFGSRFWLEQLERGATYRRYVSDGDPDTISFPADRAEELRQELADRANPY
jgi:peptidoglycan/xylan/chitin deacetylase (PgdA/CDA1 family)